MQAWILTFNRPLALMRQVYRWSSAGFDVYVYSNHPKVNPEVITYLRQKYPTSYLDHIQINNNSYAESTSYCARSWNNIFIKAFMKDGADRAVFVQDDTFCDEKVPMVVRNHQDQFDFIWAPAGDQFFYMKKEVLRRVGWFDERFLGCYCGDADFMFRIFQSYARSLELDKISIEEHHDWGWQTNPIGLGQFIPRNVESKCADANYENQHWQLEKIKNNPVLVHSQAHFKAKWGLPGNGINEIGPLARYLGAENRVGEIDWYPWFTAKYLNENTETKT